MASVGARRLCATAAGHRQHREARGHASVPSAGRTAWLATDRDSAPNRPFAPHHAAAAFARSSRPARCHVSGNRSGAAPPPPTGAGPTRRSAASIWRCSVTVRSAGSSPCSKAITTTLGSAPARAACSAPAEGRLTICRAGPARAREGLWWSSIPGPGDEIAQHRKRAGGDIGDDHPGEVAPWSGSARPPPPDVVRDDDARLASRDRRGRRRRDRAPTTGG